MEQSTTRLKFARLASVSGICIVELDNLLELNHTKGKISPKIGLGEVVFFCFSNLDSKRLLGYSLLDDQMQIESNEENILEIK